MTAYGFASLTAAYNDSKSNNGNFDNTVSVSDLTNEDDGGWYLTPNLTRLGLDLVTADTAAFFQARGKIEVDFYGGGLQPLLHRVFAMAMVKLYLVKLDFRCLPVKHGT